MSSHNFRSHAAHAKKNESAILEDLSLLVPPSQLLHAESPHVNALLEHLDDVIFSAVLGDSTALDKARMLWPQVVQAIGWELVEESREQYLRYALEVTRSSEQNGIRNPENAITAIEVISLLTRN